MIPRTGWVWLLSGLLWACGGDALPPLEVPRADLRMEVESRRVAPDEVVKVRVRASHAEDVALQATVPTAQGLEVVETGSHEERLGPNVVTVKEYQLSGPPGSYVVSLPDGVARYPDGREEKIPGSPVFVDIGVTGPHSELADIALPPPPDPIRWPWYLLAGTAVVGAGLGAWAWARRRRAVVERVPDVPPYVVAMREWQDWLERPGLDDHARALGLSEVFRRYLERTMGWPATAMTTREVCDALYKDGMPAFTLDGARRVLAPMDLLKFARQGGGRALFEGLDKDFRAVMAAMGARGGGDGDA